MILDRVCGIGLEDCNAALLQTLAETKTLFQIRTQEISQAGGKGKEEFERKSKLVACHVGGDSVIPSTRPCYLSLLQNDDMRAPACLSA